MRRIVHLSDLHFGRTSPALLEPLLDEVNALAPDLCVISGDFTQRARRWQFEEARSFIDRINAPILAVPGNHDTPLDNLWIRLTRPWDRYREFIDKNLEPTFENDRMRVVGVNTVNRWVHQTGRLSSRALKRVCTAFADAGDKARIVVLHHPLEHLEGSDKRLMRGSAKALKALAECGADVVLCGHIHTTHIGPFTTAPGLLFVQAGTGLSTRLRLQDNSFNVLDVSRAEMSVRAISASADAVFEETAAHTFRRAPEGWLRLDS
ncbi:metallophosphoesterase family protein [Falsirhodobacter sp. 20TX0035]|uniref:metallophosphoesterase family protein n=1 Tax=Falsirhodobacter sp. 20TX0035 TaxID=3022019 RepID=UPI00232D69DD|nr:metallophosphoesterase family protein [Falsirhodobacter sp. 20TX0035]MDB6453847.1 metallophosphoesterase family protein [Falsirhodobacter sp. 20TX0035]